MCATNYFPLSLLEQGKMLYCSLGLEKTYVKCKQCLNLPLSYVTRAHYCAVFIRVEMICANKERRPSSTLCCVFSSPNCKWTQPPHLLPAGRVPVSPISALLTADIELQTEVANGWGWCLINTFSLQAVLLSGVVVFTQGHNVKVFCRFTLTSFRIQFWPNLSHC